MENWEKLIAEIQGKPDIVHLIESYRISPSDTYTIWQFAMTDTDKMGYNALWLLDHIQSRFPKHVEIFLAEVCAFVRQCPDLSKRRILCKILSQHDIPTDQTGVIYEQAISWIDSPNQPVAIRVHAMEIAAKIADTYPELRDELQSILRHHYEDSSAGYKSRCRKIFERWG